MHRRSRQAAMNPASDFPGTNRFIRRRATVFRTRRATFEAPHRSVPADRLDQETSMTLTLTTLTVAAIGACVLAFGGTAHARAATTQDVSIVNAQGHRIAATLFVPVVRKRGPAVVVMPGCSGAAGGSYDALAERLAQEGYVALRVDSDTPRGTGNRCDRAAGGATAFKAAVAFHPDCKLDDAFGGVARSTWKPYASVRIVQGPPDLRRRDWSCIRRIARAQQLGAPSVSLVALRDVGQRFDAAAQRRSAEAEAIELLNGALRN